jgi:23S rRNA (pseudouridine1915-N3)-methyltransferase
MRLLVLAVGRLKQGSESELVERYRKRAAQTGRQLGLKVEMIEVRESRAAEAEKRMIEESIALSSLIPERAIVILLDRKGENLDSGALAGDLRRFRDAGHSDLVFIVGGPDGLAASLTAKAQKTLAFGAATWPHQLVRIMLMEQIYRATTILAGHPYHRS